MKKIITIVIALAVAVGCYWIGYLNGKKEEYWSRYAGAIGTAHILRTHAGLKEDGKEFFNEISDMWLYEYFSRAAPPSNEKLREPIESQLIDLIRWKQNNNYAVGFQEPLVTVQAGVIENREIVTDPAVEPFDAYRERFESFIERHEIKIQQVD